MSRPFENLVVADFSTRLSGAFAARLFGDFGASVLLCEPKNGHFLRHEPPFIADAPGEDNSFAHAYFNWNKTSLIVATEDEKQRAIDAADVVVVNSDDRRLLNRVQSRVSRTTVILCITPHGLNDPLTGVPGNNLTMAARVGWAAVNRYQDEAPLVLPRDQSGVVGGVTGYIAAAAALRRRDHGQCAEIVDVSEVEAFALTVHPWGVAAVYHGMGKTNGPGGGRRRGDPAPLWDTADGQVNLGLADFHNWKEAMEACGLPEQAENEELVPDIGRHSKDMRGAVWGLAASLPQLKRWDLFHQLARLRCVNGVVQDMRDLLDNEHLSARDFFVETEILGKTAKVSGAPAKLSPIPWQLNRPAPEFRNERFVPKKRRSRNAKVALGAEGLKRGPLSDLRVLSFGQAWSGTFATELLAFLGADVVQIASLHRPDAFRRISMRVPRGVVDESCLQHPQNTQGHYNSVNLHKREISLDLRTEEGRDILWKLIPKFDIVVDNFRPNVLPNWGITLESLHKVRPGMIWASISGYGESGPYSTYPANGATTEPMAGLSSLHGYDGDEKGKNTGGLYPDPISGYFLVATLLAAMSQRDRSGKPQRVDLSMMEAVASVIGDAVMEFSATGRLPRPQGNKHPKHAPHNIYAARDEEWIALAIESDSQWSKLIDHIALPALRDERFSTSLGRKSNEAELDLILSQWVRDQDVYHLETALMNLRIAAARVRSLAEIYSMPDEHFKESGFVSQIHHDEAGDTWLPGRPWRYSASPSAEIRPSPCVGEHSKEVLQRELGITDEAYAALVDKQITGTIHEYDARNMKPPANIGGTR